MDLFIVDIRWPPETFLRRKIEGLAAAGVKVTVCSTTAPLMASRPQDNIRFLRIPKLGGSWLNRFISVVLFAVSFLRAPRQMIRAGRLARAQTGSFKQALDHWLRFSVLAGRTPDVVHFEWNGSAIRYMPMYDELGCPVVVSCRGAQVQIKPHSPGQETLQAELHASFKQVTAVHCVSEAIRDEAMQFGLDPAKAWIIRPAVDPEFFRPAEERPAAGGPFRVVTTGSLIWRKGYEYALRAIRLVVDEGIDVQFDLIGDGPERQRVLYTISDLDLAAHVNLCGRLTPTQVRDKLQQADAFLLSSLSEGISNAVLEAMACGLPVVTTDCGGMREAVTDGAEGIVVPVRDPQAMAEALAELAGSAELREQMGRAARRRVESEFGLEQQIQHFLQLYRSVTTSPTRHSMSTIAPDRHVVEEASPVQPSNSR